LPSASSARSARSAPGAPGAPGAVVAYGYDPEPLGCTNRHLLAAETEKVIDGLCLLVRSLGARQGIICLPGEDESLRARAAAAVAGREEIQLERGEEVLLPRLATVERLESLVRLAEAASGQVPTSTYVSCAGEVKDPALLRVPLGTPLREVIAACGEPRAGEYVLLTGGALSGEIEGDFHKPVNAETRSLLLLPSGHPLARSRSLAEVLIQSRAACCGCGFCTAFCRAALAGEAISPHRIMRQLNLGISEPEDVLLGALSCRECGVCEAVCVMSLSPRRIIRALRQRLEPGKTASRSHEGAQIPRPEAIGRRPSRSWFLARLGLAEYGNTELRWGGDLEAERIELELPAGAAIRVGRTEDVKRGDVVAETEGWTVHASISGRVLVAEEGRLIIVNESGEKH
jgi:hypothetical protein